eukprot:TRINITY_DN7435_c0_g1_i1.p1 TRINITY_DN7435_c0_g1~~TRINITY_DN7435_c0_g1_i1.p1  ORF type:complete len:537 (+),score=170.35 TRINITY_DN7435_c0_g1_i1:48-1658(+)
MSLIRKIKGKKKSSSASCSTPAAADTSNPSHGSTVVVVGGVVSFDELAKQMPRIEQSERASDTLGYNSDSDCGDEQDEVKTRDQEEDLIVHEVEAALQQQQQRTEEGAGGAAAAVAVIAESPDNNEAYWNGVNDLFDPFLDLRLRKHGGLEAFNEKKMAKQRAAVWNFIKLCGKNILSGNVMHISMPVGMCWPRSFLESVSDQWAYFVKYISLAAQVRNDPVQRLKHVVTFAIAGLHLTCSMEKPFNPILGETLQGVYSDGTELFMEQMSHHPPISSWNLVSHKNGVELHGFGVALAKMKGNCLHGGLGGKSHVVFTDDGTEIVYNFPKIVVGGIIMGRLGMEYVGVLRFEDEKNGLICEVRFDPAGNADRGLFSSGKSDARTDELEGAIWRVVPAASDASKLFFLGNISDAVQLDQDNLQGKFICQQQQQQSKKQQQAFAKQLEKVASFSGSYLGSLFSDDGQELWNLERNRPDAQCHQAPATASLLPSDCRLREDRNLLATGDWTASQLAKDNLETVQRKDRQLRKALGPKRSG